MFLYIETSLLLKQKNNVSVDPCEICGPGIVVIRKDTIRYSASCQGHAPDSEVVFWGFFPFLTLFLWLGNYLALGKGAPP